jgi:beta-aspartyl-peptidase (threonine type)
MNRPHARSARALALVAALLAPLGCAPQAAPDTSPGGQTAAASRQDPRWGIVIHGGAGTITRASMTPEREAEYNAALTRALQTGHAVLERGGSSLDAVVAAINVMEDSPLFNAGKGAVFTHEGKNELDAAIMDGTTLRAGAVAGLRRVRNPIDLARAVMERSPHVMMIGEGAEAFAREQRVELVPESYFHTEARWRSLQRALEEEKKKGPAAYDAASEDPETNDRKFGTVGAVALDRSGRLAAGTSTGGMTNKRWGRVGDVPIIGAGTYASPNCAVSATGHGEYFIRYTVAHDICARMQYRNASLTQAADKVVMDVLVKAGGEGGIIAMDGRGNYTMPFNSAGMYRGYMGPDGKAFTAIYRD